jgi:hypothetical protein
VVVKVWPSVVKVDTLVCTLVTVPVGLTTTVTTGVGAVEVRSSVTVSYTYSSDSVEEGEATGAAAEEAEFSAGFSFWEEDGEIVP